MADPSAQTRLSRGFTAVVQIIAAVTALAYVASAVLAFVARARLDTFADSDLGFAEFEDWADADDVMRGAFGWSFLTTFALVVLLIIWLALAANSVGRHRLTDRTFGTGWAVGAWFVPIANLLLPWLVFRENERIAQAAASGRAVVWKHTHLGFTSKAWWFLVIGGQTLLQIGSGIAPVETSTEIDDYRLGYVFEGIGAAIVAIGTAMLIFVLGRTARLDNAAPALTPAPGY